MTGRQSRRTVASVTLPTCETCGAPSTIELRTHVLVESATVDGTLQLQPVSSRCWCDEHAPSSTPEEFIAYRGAGSSDLTLVHDDGAITFVPPQHLEDQARRLVQDTEYMPDVPPLH